MSDAITYELDGSVAVVRIDDGKANAYSPDLLTALDDAITRAESEATALLLIGRPGRFSAGFDLSVMTSGLEPMRALVTQGARALLRIYGLGLPTVAACTGHALAAGALTLLACDSRIGADGDAKIGLNEVAIGMGLPKFAVEMACDRVSKRHLTAATIFARIYSPAEAVDAGYLDRVVPAAELDDAALAEARRLAELNTTAVAVTKRNLRRAAITHMLATLDADMASVGAPAP